MVTKNTNQEHKNMFLSVKTMLFTKVWQPNKSMTAPIDYLKPDNLWVFI